MIQYRVSYTKPHRHFISFEASFPVNGRKRMQLQLPSWRPGRYELGNFSKNIRAFTVSGVAGNVLSYTRLSKDLWEVECTGEKEVILNYQYYAADLNAGSTFLDKDQLYINPVNCFYYSPDEVNSDYEISFELPQEYVIACGLRKKAPHVLWASSFDELADCPLIASSSLKHLEYSLDGVLYHLWIQGEVKLDEARLVNEFAAFTRTQLLIFGRIPCTEYHFLFHFTPYFVRHGVEHSNSTVIAMGPAADFQGEALFKDLLGISCHELFHTWNIKSIRPAEMLPYSFTKENYSTLGYVYEGVTTYYGDLLLWRSGGISELDWLDAIEERLQAYYDNPGRFNLSVAESSFDTWLDGYGPGIPWRKVSIYNEGFLIALICDIHIISHTDGKYSLDDAMKKMFDEYGDLKRGYTEADYRHILVSFGGDNIQYIFDQYVNGTTDYTESLQNAFSRVGLVMHPVPSPKWSEAMLGLMVEEVLQKTIVHSVIENSPADNAGLWMGDEIVSVNGIVPYKNFQWLLRMEGSNEITISRKGKLQTVMLVADGNAWGKKYRLMRTELLSANQLRFLDRWKNGK